MSWTHWTNAALADIRTADRWRVPTVFEGAGPEGLVHGTQVLSFASNDYLGLATHPVVRAAAIAAIEHYGTGATASRLIVGSRQVHEALEAELAAWQRMPRALVFASGYAANLAVLSVFGTEDVTIFSDALNHASIIDGARLARAQVRVYRHLDLDDLETQMHSCRTRKLVVTDSVFSMDGDVAPLPALEALCARHDALLVVDEAHAVLEPVTAPAACALLRVGTLSKTLGAVGGWVSGDAAFIDLLVNRGRTFIFSTALPPADAAAALAALRICTGDEGDALRARLRASITRVRAGHPSPIVPVILGTDAAALTAARALLARGIHVPAIRPPTVPAGTARLRIALSAAHTHAMVGRLLAALAGLEGAETVASS